MKVLMLHHADGNAGGGQVQMGRLRSALREEGVEARILCRHRVHDDSILIPRRPFLEKALKKLTHRVGLNDIHLVGSKRVLENRAFQDSDLIDLHCLHSETFSYLGLPALTSRKPTVFTFHDMWPMTGHCHASLECERWKTGCGSCPHPETYPAVRRDATAIEWRLKKWAYARSTFSIVAPSRWLCDRIRDSLLGGFQVHHIPHGLDLEVFKPLDQRKCRERLGIPEGKRVILFAAESMMRPLKGADHLVLALKLLPERLKRDCILVVFGEANSEILSQMPIPVINLGYLHEDKIKAAAYSAADLLLNTSRAESFGLVVLESIACGTPVVSYAVGGVPDLVRPGVTGYLANPDDLLQLASHVSAFFEDPSRAGFLSSQCRQVAEAEYSIRSQASSYREIYQMAIESRSFEKGHSATR